MSHDQNNTREPSKYQPLIHIIYVPTTVVDSTVTTEKYERKKTTKNKKFSKKVEDVTQEYHSLKLEVFRLGIYISEEDINRYNERDIMEEFHENCNIKTIIFIEVKRGTKTKNVTHIDKNKGYSLKVNQ